MRRIWSVVLGAPLMLLGLVVARRRWRSLAPLYLVLGCFILMVLLYYGTPRFTVTVLPVLLVFASTGALHLADRMRRPR